MKNLLSLTLGILIGLGIICAVAGTITLVSAGIDAVQSYYETQERTQRNEWGQKGAPGCETILKWTEVCDGADNP